MPSFKSAAWIWGLLCRCWWRRVRSTSRSARSAKGVDAGQGRLRRERPRPAHRAASRRKGGSNGASGTNASGGSGGVGVSGAGGSGGRLEARTWTRRMMAGDATWSKRVPHARSFDVRRIRAAVRRRGRLRVDRPGRAGRLHSRGLVQDRADVAHRQQLLGRSGLIYADTAEQPRRLRHLDAERQGRLRHGQRHDRSGLDRATTARHQPPSPQDNGFTSRSHATRAPA